MTWSIKWFPIAPHNKSEQMRPTKETWIYRSTKETSAHDVQHKIVPCCTPQQVGTKETYKKDLQKRPTKETRRRNQQNDKMTKETFKF